MLASPLHRLSSKGVAWAWSAACAAAFQAIKQALTTAPCLAFPDFSQPFEVHTDASLHGLGAVLYQNGRPVAFESRGLTPAEINYATGEQELLAVVHALTVWRCYLKGAPEFRVVTDHKAITYLDSLPTLSRRCVGPFQTRSRFESAWKAGRAGRTRPARPAWIPSYDRLQWPPGVPPAAGAFRMLARDAAKAKPTSSR